MRVTFLLLSLVLTVWGGKKLDAHSKCGACKRATHFYLYKLGPTLTEMRSRRKVTDTIGFEVAEVIQETLENECNFGTIIGDRKMFKACQKMFATYEDDIQDLFASLTVEDLAREQAYDFGRLDSHTWEEDIWLDWLEQEEDCMLFRMCRELTGYCTEDQTLLEPPLSNPRKHHSEYPPYPLGKELPPYPAEGKVHIAVTKTFVEIIGDAHKRDVMVYFSFPDVGSCSRTTGTSCPDPEDGLEFHHKFDPLFTRLAELFEGCSEVVLVKINANLNEIMAPYHDIKSPRVIMFGGGDAALMNVMVNTRYGDPSMMETLSWISTAAANSATTQKANEIYNDYLQRGLSNQITQAFSRVKDEL